MWKNESTPEVVLVAADILILRPFNGVFFGLFFLFAALFAGLSVLLRKRSEDARRKTLAGLMLFTLVGFIVYKYFLSIDADYAAIAAAAGMGGFSWWSELPLHLCNINTILIPIAMFTKRRPLESFCFFMAPLGAAMALAMPSYGFDCYSILLPRMLGFYFTHFMVFFSGIALWSFGIYKPTFKDLLPTVILVFCLTLGIFCINMLMRLTGVNPHANYFYCVETEGNPILALFYRWIPVPFLYTIPCTLILVPYMLLVTSLFRLPRRKKAEVSV